MVLSDNFLEMSSIQYCGSLGIRNGPGGQHWTDLAVPIDID
jgi:hypothetical protein